MNQLERIRKMHVRIMSHKTWCAFGPLVAAGTTTCTTDIPTAATNGRDVLVDRVGIAVAQSQ